MKSIFTPFLFLLFSLMGISTLFAKESPVTKEFKLSGVSSLKLNVVLNMEIHADASEEKIVFEGDQDLLKKLNVHQKGNCAIAEMKGNFNSSKQKGKLHIYIKKIERLESTSVGNIAFQNYLNTDAFTLINSGVGNVTLKLNVDQFDCTHRGVGNLNLYGTCKKSVVNNSGVGNILAEGFKIEVLDLKNSAVGNSTFYATKSFIVTSTSVGNLTLLGPAKPEKINHTGVGKLSMGVKTEKSISKKTKAKQAETQDR